MIAVSVSTGRVVATLLNAVKAIVEVGAKEQMLRADATAIGDVPNGIAGIALVADIHTWRHRAISEFPGEDVGRLPNTTPTNAPVAITAYPPKPHPALASSVYLDPEGFRHRHLSLAGVVATPPAINDADCDAIMFRLVGPSLERLPADGAGKEQFGLRTEAHMTLQSTDRTDYSILCRHEVK
jgi:hypothetical protein